MSSTMASTPSGNMTETSIEEENMAADLRQRYNAINANIKEQREQSECGATVPIITKALSWSSNPDYS
jgi:hypothetical protein